MIILADKLWFLILDEQGKENEQSEDDEPLICSICLEIVLADDFVAPCCSVVFHMACISRWTTYYSKSCPICRKKLA